jgi:hypothetical protein
MVEIFERIIEKIKVFLVKIKLFIKSLIKKLCFTTITKTNKYISHFKERGINDIKLR